MESVFWNKESILFVECLKKGSTIKTICYISLLDKVKQAMVSINGRGSCKNNCFSSRTTSLQTWLPSHNRSWLINSEVLEHPAYSPYLAPSGCHVCCRQVCSSAFSILSGWLKETAAAE
jgi:hypothetical protein